MSSKTIKTNVLYSARGQSCDPSTFCLPFCLGFLGLRSTKKLRKLLNSEPWKTSADDSRAKCQRCFVNIFDKDIIQTIPDHRRHLVGPDLE